jgi:O-antigen/teichoic acid export membrane protein
MVLRAATNHLSRRKKVGVEIKAKVMELKPRRLLGNRLVRDSAVVITFTLLTGIVNYCFQVIMGRGLGPAGYSQFAALIGMGYVLMVPVQVIQVWMMEHVCAEGELGLRVVLARRGVFVLAIGGGGLALSLVSRNFIAHQMGIADVGALVALLSGYFIQLLLPLLTGILLAQERYTRFGAVQLVNFGGRLASGMILVALGHGTQGAIWGVAIGGILAILTAGLLLAKNGCWKGSTSAKPGRVDVKYLLLLLSTFLFFNFMFMIDVIFVKRFAPAEFAGSYAAAATLSKAILFVTMPIANALFPKVAGGRMKGVDGNTDSHSALIIALLIAGGIGVAGIAGLAFIASPLIGVLYGTAYSSAVDFGVTLGGAMLAFAVAYILIFDSLSKRHIYHLPVLAVTLVLQLVLLSRLTRSAALIPYAMLISAGTLALGVAAAKAIHSAIRCRAAVPTHADGGES